MTACALAITIVLAFLTGAVIGLVLAMFHGTATDHLLALRLVGAALGFAISIASFPFWLRWVLGRRFGRVRLAVVVADEVSPESSNQPRPPEVVAESDQ